GALLLAELGPVFAEGALAQLGVFEKLAGALLDLVFDPLVFIGAKLGLAAQQLVDAAVETAQGVARAGQRRGQRWGSQKHDQETEGAKAMSCHFGMTSKPLRRRSTAACTLASLTERSTVRCWSK